MGQSHPPFLDRSHLWDPGPQVGTFDRGSPGAGGEDSTEENSISAVSAARTRGSWKESSQWALSDGSRTRGKEDFVDPGYLRYQEKVCTQDGALGPGKRRK